MSQELPPESGTPRRRFQDEITTEDIERAVQRVMDRRIPPADSVQAGVDRIEELTLTHLADAFSKAQSVLSSRVDELVRAAVGPALAQSLVPIREELAGLKDGVSEAKRTAVDTKSDLESRMKAQESATAAIDAALAENSLKTAGTASLIQTLMDDQRAQRESREEQERLAKEEREAKEAYVFQVAKDRAERLEWILKWGLGVIASLVVGGVVIEIGTWLQRSGGLTPTVGAILVACGIALVAVLALWVHRGFGPGPVRQYHPPPAAPANVAGGRNP